MPVKQPAPGELEPIETASRDETAGAAAAAAEVDAAARLRQRAALPQGLRCEGRASRRPEAAGRPREVSVHHQGGPARQLSVRHVRGAARAGGARARVVGHDRQADGGRLHAAATSTIWADLVARSIRAAGGRAGDIVHVAYGYGLFTGGLGAHYGAERAGLHGGADVRRPDREAGAADPRFPARHHHGHAQLHAGDHRGDRAPGAGPARDDR